MRINEIVLEDRIPPTTADAVSDGAVNDRYQAHGYDDIMNVLVTMRNNLLDKHAIPQEDVEQIVLQVNALRGDNSFRWTDLNDAIKSGQFKDVIEKVEPDPHTGKNMVLFTSPDTEIAPDAALGGTGSPAGDPAKVVSSMAKRAATS